MFEQIISEVKKYNNVIIFPHTNMDGDSVGSAKAIALALKKIGKNVVVLGDEAVPEYVGFLNHEVFVTKLPDGFENSLAFAVDCSDNTRIENRMDVWSNCKSHVCIDHHPGENSFADIIVRDPKASAAAMLVFDFIKEFGIEIDKEIAEALYTAILTDTGNFKYSSAGASTLRAAADLYEYGVDHVRICNLVFDNKPLKQVKIETSAINNAEFLAGGKAAVSYVKYDYWTSLEAPYSYAETAIDSLRAIKGVEVAAILKEKEPGVFKVSFRSKNGQDVSGIARKYGGGGHKPAAACTLNMTFEEAFELIKKEIVTVL